jgi:hypothetical protein
MKKLFSTPSFALALTLVLMIASVLLNTRIKLGKQCDTLCERFYGDGTISASLTSLCDASEQLARLGERYQVDDADDALEITRSVRELLQEHSYDAEEIYDRYYALLKSAFSLEGTLARAALSEEDAGAFVSAQHAAAEAKAAIDNASYNELVRIFLNRNHRFPTPQLASFSGVHMPELFA